MGVHFGKGKRPATHWLKVLRVKDELGRRINCVLHTGSTELESIGVIEELLAKHNPTKHKLQYLVYGAFWAEVLANDETPTGNVTDYNPHRSE